MPDPNDPYSAFLADELLSINSAMRELEYRCYADNGYPEYLEVLPALKANEFRSSASTPDYETTFRAFSESPWFTSEENARATGYGSSIPGLDAQVVPDDRSILKVFEDCRQASLRRTSGNEDVVNAYSQLGNVLAETLATSPSQNKDALTKRVFECMDKGRYPVDPNGPHKSIRWGVDFGVPLGVAPRMPEAVDLTQGTGTKVIPAEPTQHYFPTAEESESAAAMYRCSLETGAQTDWNRANNDTKNAALAKNEATLTELNPKIRELAKSAAAAVQTKP
ncbi:hypothetical protein [Sinomonas sp. P47F7]|uniref:hypothetical protein n=1 Tax=Sinomonas sp. P47F7 TaxID=3410987 RepID=UPI003BF558B5